MEPPKAGQSSASPQEAWPFPTGRQPSPVSIAVTRNDDAWDEQREDMLSVDDDAKAFARLAVLKEFNPPLAVGVCGAWGNGKSFFMKLIHRHVARLKGGVPTFEAPEAGSGRFHRQVVQIKFNAWHYAETNLWASLVEHIFHELALATTQSGTPAVLGQLHTARELTLETARALVLRAREREAATKVYLEAKEDAQVLRFRLDPVAACKSMLIEVFNDDSSTEVQEARESVQKAAEELGLGELALNTGKLTVSGTELLNEGVKGANIISSIAQRAGSFWFAAWFVALVVVGYEVIPLALNYASHQLIELQGVVRELVGAALGAIAVLAGALNYLLGPTKSAIKRLKKAKSILDSHVDTRRKDLEDKVKLRNADVASADVRLKAASEHLKEAMEKLAAVNDELYGQTPANRLINFVRARAADGTYAQHLGLVSAIRRDFEQLSECLNSRPIKSKPRKDDDDAFKKQVNHLIDEASAVLSGKEMEDLRSLATERSDVPLPFQRIILYIDDVDRCSPEKVLEVLQAVHMLLAFPLFVVFVAVDVRWVASSLARQYPGMLKEPLGTESVTSASHYLEKIFQLPYWVPGLAPETAELLLLDVLDAIGKREEAAESLEKSAASGPVKAGGMRKAVRVKLDKLTKEQIAAVGSYARHIRSPRKLLRLANVVRLLKVSGHIDEDYEKEAPHLHALLTQVTIATAVPDLYTEWESILRALVSSRDNLVTCTKMSESLFLKPDGGIVSAVLKTFMENSQSSDWKTDGADDLLVHAALARRFSFAL